MDTTAGQPVDSAPLSGALRVGEHVHQLLNLAHALATATTKPAPSPGSRTAATGPAEPAEPCFSIGEEVGALSDRESLSWAQELEQLQRCIQALSVQIAGDLSNRVTAGRYAQTGASGPIPFLVQTLQISAAEASRRIHLAHHIMPAIDTITGTTTETPHPVLAEAFFKGTLSQERALSVTHYLEEAGRLAENGRISQDKYALVEETLVNTAELQGPDFIRTIGNRIMSQLDPDGHKPSASDLKAKQGLFFRKARRGLVSIHGACTIEQYEQLIALIGFTTNPNKHTDINTLNTNGPGGTETGNNETTGTGTTGAGNSPGTGPGHHGQSSFMDLLNEATTLLNTDSNHQDSSGTRKENKTATDRHPSPATSPAADPGDHQAAQPGPPPPEPADLREPEPPDPPQPTPPAPQPKPEPAPQPAPEPERPSSLQDLMMNGWRRRLEPWEIPPRPPEAPENAIPPVFPGEKWFWFPTDPHTTGWNKTTTTADDFQIWAPQPEPPDTDTEPEPPGTDPWAQHTPKPEHGPDADPGFGPGWDSRGLGEPPHENNQDGQSPEPWPHLINGINVPAPGSNHLPTHPGGGSYTDLFNSIDPTSTDPAVKDTRTHGQKLLDGLLSCVKLAARTGQLPLNGGLKAQLILSCSEEELHHTNGTGTIYTTHTGPVPLHLFEQSLCDPEITRFTYGQGQTIINAGHTQRLYTPAQRKLLYARDLGCTFPDCTTPATWTEAHHITPWHQGGETNLNNAALLCDYHHTLLHHSDWQAQLINGTPWYTPPWTIDPTQTPRRNNYHHGLPKNQH